MTLTLDINTLADDFSIAKSDQVNCIKVVAPIPLRLVSADVLCLLVHRNAVCQLWIQSADVYNLVQQPYSNQPSGDIGSCQVYSGSFYKLGK